MSIQDHSHQDHGLVKEIRGGKALVEIHRKEACEHCAARNFCGVTHSKSSQIWLENALSAQPGDQVQLTISEGSMLGASFIVWGIPLLAFFGGILVGYYLNPSSEIVQVMGGAIGLGVGAIMTIILDRHYKKKGKFQITISNIISINQN